MIESRWRAEKFGVLVSVVVAGLRFRCHFTQRNFRDGIVVTEAMGPPDIRVLRSSSAIGAARAPASDLGPDLVASLSTQILGMALCRFVLRLPTVVEMSRDEIVEWLGPMIQRYLGRPEG